MSQREDKFQSKSRFGGGKGKSGDFKGRGKPGGGFGKKFEGDRPPRADGDRPKRAFGDKPRSFGDKPKRPFGDGPKRAYGDKPRSFSDRKPRDAGFERKPRYTREDSAGGGDRPYQKREFKPREGGSDRPYVKREYKPREGGSDRPYEKREYKPREDRGAGADRPYQKREFKPREGGSDRPYVKREYKPREGGSDRPYEKREYKPRDGGDFKPREGGFDRKPREGGFDRKPREDRGERDFKPRAPRGGGDKPFKRYGDKPGFKPRRETTRFEPNGDAGPAAEGTFETKAKLKSERSNYGAPSSAFLYGAHAVKEALKNSKRLHQRLLCTKRGFEAIAEAFQEGADDGNTMPQVLYVEKEDIDRLLPRDAVHQDILLDTQPLDDILLADLLLTEKDNENAKIIVLDQVTDPHNVGAIMRSAAAFGAIAVVAQKLHAPDITGIVAKAASGAVEHIPLVKETNLSRALEQLKEAGYFCIGLAEEGKQTLGSLKLTGRVALVLGAEGDGIRRLVSEKCDELVKLPTQGEIGSLNVSNAAAVALYELVRE